MQLEKFFEAKEKSNSNENYVILDKDRRILYFEEDKKTSEAHLVFKYPNPLNKEVLFWSKDKEKFKKYLEEEECQDIIKDLDSYTFKDYEEYEQEGFDIVGEGENAEEYYEIQNEKGEFLCVEEIKEGDEGYPGLYLVLRDPNSCTEDTRLVFWSTDRYKLRVYLIHMAIFDKSEGKHGISEIFENIDAYTFKEVKPSEDPDPYRVDETEEEYIMMTKRGMVFCECTNENDEDRFPRIELLHPTDVTYYDPVTYHTNTFNGFMARMKAYQEQTHLVYDPFKKFNLTEDEVVFMKLSDFKAKYYWGFWKRDMNNEFDAVDEESQFVIENEKGEIFGISWETGEPVFQPLEDPYNSIPCFTVAVFYNDIDSFMRHFGPSFKAWGQTIDPEKLKFREVTGEYDDYEFVQ